MNVEVIAVPVASHALRETREQEKKLGRVPDGGTWPTRPQIYTAAVRNFLCAGAAHVNTCLRHKASRLARHRYSCSKTYGIDSHVTIQLGPPLRRARSGSETEVAQFIAFSLEDEFITNVPPPARLIDSARRLLVTLL